MLNPINLTNYPINNYQSVYTAEGNTALELAGITAKKVNECVEVVNAVDAIATQSQQIVQEMKSTQTEFVLANNDTRAELISENSNYLDALQTAQNQFKDDLNASKLLFYTDINKALSDFKASNNTDYEEFKTALNTAKTQYQNEATGLLADFQETLNSSVILFNDNADNAITQFNTNVSNVVNTALNNKINDGSIGALINTTLLDAINKRIDNMGEINVKDYGAKGDKLSDDIQAFKNAVNTGMNVIVPPGDYLLSESVVLKKVGQKIKGAGVFATKLIATTPNLPVITVPNGFSEVDINYLTLDRNVPAVMGGDGIRSLGVFSNCNYNHLGVFNQFNGLSLGSTDFGTVSNILFNSNYNDAIYLENNGTYNNCQWIIKDILLSGNDGHGIMVIGSPDATGMSLGNWHNINSFANSKNAIAISGNANCGVYGLRLSNSFLGGDGQSEIRLDSYGSMHIINDVFCESSGTSFTGRSNKTPSNVGDGIEITPNNQDCIVSNCYVATNSGNGITSHGQNTTISNCVSKSNGLANTPNFNNGIAVYAGSANIVGNKSFYNQIGLYCADGKNILLSSNDLTGNVVNSLVCVVNQGDMITSANKPYEINLKPILTPTLINGWTSYGIGYSTPGYWKDHDNTVHLKGQFKSGGLGTSIFDLPVGYRPSATLKIPVLSNEVLGVIYINNSGNITLMAGSTESVSLDNVTFRAEL